MTSSSTPERADLESRVDAGASRESGEPPPTPRLHVSIVTGDRLVYDGTVDRAILPGIDGQLSIRASHAPLLAALRPGELVVRRGDDEIRFSVGRGFAEVVDNVLTILADSAAREEGLDAVRAEAARRRARLLARRERGSS